MKKRSMNLFLWLPAVFFAASVHAYSDTYDVLVAEVNGVFHPLSVAGKNNAANPPIDSNQLVWGKPLGMPALISEQEEFLVKLDPDGNIYLKLSESGLVISNEEIGETKFYFNMDGTVMNHVLFSCPDGQYHTLQTKERVNTAKLVGCQETKLRVLPFDPQTRNIVLPTDRGIPKTKTSLSVPEESPLVLFASLGYWRPLTVDFNGQDKGRLPFIYDNPNQNPMEFHFQNGQLVSSIKQVPGFACFESSTFYFSNKECSKETSYISYSKLKDKKMNVCTEDYEEDFCNDAKIQLFYFQRDRSDAITDKTIDIPSTDESAVPAQQESQPESRPESVFTTDDNESSQHPLESPKPLMVFAVKNGDFFTPLTFITHPTGYSVLTHGDFGNPPKFEFSKGIATTKDTDTPGNVQINKVALRFGKIPGTTFTVAADGKVNHEFYSCQNSGKSSVDLFTTPPKAENFNCTPETVYFLPYDKVIRTVENGSPNQGSKGAAVTKNKGPADIPAGTNPSDVDLSKEPQAMKMVWGNNDNHSQNPPNGNIPNGQHNDDQENHDSSGFSSGSNPSSSSGSSSGSNTGSSLGSSSGSNPGSSLGSDSGSNPGSGSGSSSGSKSGSDSGSKKESTEKSNMLQVTSKKKSQNESENSDDSQEHEGQPTTGKTDVDSTNPAIEGNEKNVTVNGKTDHQPEVKMDTENQSEGRKGESVNTKKVEENKDKNVNVPKPAVGKAQNPKTVEPAAKPVPKAERLVDQPQVAGSETMASVSPVRVPKVSGNETGIPSPKVVVSGTNITTSGMEVGTLEFNTNVSQLKVEISGFPNVSESVKVSSKHFKVFPVSASEPQTTEMSNVSVSGTSEAKAIAEDTKNYEGKSSSDTLNDTLNNEVVSNLNGNSTISAKANPTTTACTACQHGSQTTVWKTYTDYTTYCPQETTLTITKCDKECVPSTMSVAAASTLTVTGVCIVPETTTVITGKEHSEEEGRLNGGGKSEQKVNVEDIPSQKDGQKVHDQKDSVGQNEGSKTSQPKPYEVKAENNVKDEANSGNSGNGTSGTSGTSKNSAIGEKAIEPFVNTASKNAFGACIVAFAALLL